MLAAALGWLGTVGTFVAYALLWRGRVTSESRRYAALNTVGGLLGGAGSVLYGAWPSAAANFAWAALGLHALIGAHRRRRLELQVNGMPGSVPVIASQAPDAGNQDPGLVGDPLERAAGAQAPAGPHRHPARMVPQLCGPDSQCA